jgi:hypothetical protein
MVFPLKPPFTRLKETGRNWKFPSYGHYGHVHGESMMNHPSLAFFSPSEKQRVSIYAHGGRPVTP